MRNYYTHFDRAAMTVGFADPTAACGAGNPLPLLAPAAPTTAEPSGKNATQRKCWESFAFGPVFDEDGVTVVRLPPLEVAQNLRCFAPHWTISGPPGDASPGETYGL